MSDLNSEFHTRLREMGVAAKAALKAEEANRQNNAESDDVKRTTQELLRAMEAYLKAANKEIEFRKLHGIDGPSPILT